VAFWRRPSELLYYAGLALAGGLIVLWVLTRFLIPPFEYEPGPIDVSGLVCKLSMLVGFISLIALAAQGQISGMTRRSTWRLAGVALGLAVLSGLALYGIGRAAEPLLPSLAPPDEHTESETDSGHEMEGGEVSGHDDTEDDHEAGPSGEAMTIGDLKIAGIWSRPASANTNGVIYLSITTCDIMHLIFESRLNHVEQKPTFSTGIDPGSACLGTDSAFFASNNPLRMCQTVERHWECGANGSLPGVPAASRGVQPLFADD
jgi:hypothetical protein